MTTFARLGRGLLWVLFPPLGWYASARARHARRHRELIRAARS